MQVWAHPGPLSAGTEAAAALASPEKALCVAYARHEEVPVGRCNDPDVHAVRAGRTEALEGKLKLFR